MSRTTVLTKACLALSVVVLTAAVWPGDGEAVVVAVDGVNFVKTLLPGTVSDKNPDTGYLAKGLQSVSVVGGAAAEPFRPVGWHGDAVRTDKALVNEVAVQILRAYNESKFMGEKLVVVGHSWGSVLAYAALDHLANIGSSVKVDSFVTLGSPLGYLDQFNPKAKELHEIAKASTSVTPVLDAKQKMLEKEQSRLKEAGLTQLASDVNLTDQKSGLRGEIAERTIAYSAKVLDLGPVQKPSNVDQWTNFQMAGDPASTEIKAAKNHPLDKGGALTLSPIVAHRSYYGGARDTVSVFEVLEQSVHSIERAKELLAGTPSHNPLCQHE